MKCRAAADQHRFRYPVRTIEIHQRRNQRAIGAATDDVLIGTNVIHQGVEVFHRDHLRRLAVEIRRGGETVTNDIGCDYGVAALG